VFSSGNFSGIKFEKMHGNGNDFIMIDEFEDEIVMEDEKPLFASIYCNRRLGIGADGVIFLQKSDVADVRMRLFQQDKSEAEMCGNGIRCLVRFAHECGRISGGKCTVETLAGIIPITYHEEDGFWVQVEMGKVSEISRFNINHTEVFAVDTGVPHAVVFVNDLDFDIEKKALPIRWSEKFPRGTNVDFVKIDEGEVVVRTFERGVEGETLSCGTGAVASAVVAKELGMVGDEVVVRTKGGVLKVSFEGGTAYLEGCAEKVFKGIIV